MTQRDKDIHISNINSAKKKKKEGKLVFTLLSVLLPQSNKKGEKNFCINITVISLKTGNIQ